MRKFNAKPRQAVAVGNLIEKENLMYGVEIGVFRGETTFYLLNRFPDLYLYAVDLWKTIDWGDTNDEGYRSYDQFPLHEYKKEVYQKAKDYPELTIIEKDSAEAALSFPDESFDFVFIDGDHTYKGVKRDIEAWLPKVKQGGWITGHDIHMEGVKKAVLENFTSYEELDNFVWIIKK